MKKNTKKALFLLFVLLLFSSCSEKITDCSMKPKITVEMSKEIESQKEKLKIGKRELYFSCNF